MLVWDGYGLQSTHSGIGRHALELAQELECLGRPPRIVPSGGRLDPAFSKWRADLPPLPFGRLKPLALLAAGYQANVLVRSKKSSEPALFHGLSNYNIPSLPSGFRTVLTIHDLIPFLFPEGVSKSLHRYLSYQMPKAVHRADHIVCVSEWTAYSVKNQFPHAKDKVVVIPNGRPSRKALSHKALSSPVRLFSLSRGEIYKRLDLIPSILQKLPRGFEWHVLSDGRGCAQLAGVPGLVLHQSLSDEAVEELWRSADIFVHPSLWEGYCLPAVTALSYQIPTVYTGGSGIDEVVGEAGIRLGAADSIDHWVDAIRRVSESKREFTERCSIQWERLPAWPEVAEQLAGLYDNMSL